MSTTIVNLTMKPTTEQQKKLGVIEPASDVINEIREIMENTANNDVEEIARAVDIICLHAAGYSHVLLAGKTHIVIPVALRLRDMDIKYTIY